MRLRLLAAGLAASMLLLSQDDVPSFPRRAYFHNAFGPIDSRVELQTPVRLSEYVVDGKLELSLRAYLDAVFANNTDIAIQKLQVEIPKNAITRAFGVFDPIARVQLSATRTSSQLLTSNNTIIDSNGNLVGSNGASVRNTVSQPFSLTYNQFLPTGATYNISYNAIRNADNINRDYNAYYNSGFNFNFAQPLLRGRGAFFSKLPITVARSRRQAAVFSVQDQVMRLVSTAENAYWDVVSARESLRVQEKALGLAAESLKRAKRELELGASSPLDIYQPEQQYANAEIGVTQARFNLTRSEDILRRQMGADLDPALRTLPIVLTESPTVPNDNAVYDRETLVARGLSARPDLTSARQNIDVDDLQIRQFKNLLLPNLSLTAQYGSFGNGANFLPTSSFIGSNGATVLPGGFGGAFTQMFGFGLPVYGLGVSLQLPIRDHVNMANLADARVTKRQDLLTIRTTEQQIRQEVLNAITNVESSRASVKLSQIALDYAQKRVDAEQKKYDLGTTTIFFLLAAQTDLTRAESDLVNQVILYKRNVLALSLRTGDLLQERNLIVQP